MDFRLHTLDALVLVAYVLGVVLIGLWVGRRQTSLASYLLGDRDLPWWAILGSIVATETSTASLLSVPGLAFAAKSGDFRFLQLAFGYIVGRTLIVFLFLPLFFEGRLYTAYEVLERRFGGLTQRVASLIFLVCRNLGDGLRLFLTAIVLAKVLGWNLPVCVVAVGLATALYTYYGGIRAVVWNDCVQFVIYVLGGVAAIAVVLQRLPGGWEQCLEYARTHDKLRLFDFSFSWQQPFTFWAGLVGGMFLTLGTHGTDQMMVQRYLGARSQRGAGAALLLSGFVVLAQFALFLFLGVALASFYAEFPRTTPFGADQNDQVVATFVVEELPPGVGLIGLLLAAVFAAAMSTLSSSLNSSASAAVNDFYLAGRRDQVDPQHSLRATRWFTLLFAAIQIAVGIAASYLSKSVVTEALAIAGFAAGLLLGLFALGVWARGVGERSALVGMLVGLAALLAVKFGPAVPAFFNAGEVQRGLAWPWFPVVGSLATFAAAVVHSWVTGKGRCVSEQASRPRLQIGLERVLADPPTVLAGARFGLLLNHASVDARLQLACDLLAARFPGQLVALFTPQHGMWGEQQANMVETPHGRYSPLDLSMHSLYSETRQPTSEMLRGLDLFVIDLQDVGTRVYTFAWTVVGCLQACAAEGIPVLLLDRPNPLGGQIVEGPLLDPNYRSFVGGAEIPMRHGLTLGELAAHVNQSLGIRAALEVVPVFGWGRDALWSASGRTWVPPSPNMPRPETALLYPGTVLLEGTNLSEGRGTTRPFELLGAPFLDPRQLAAEASQYPLPGLALRPVRFRPTDDKWAGESCGGVAVHVTDPHQVRSYAAGVAILAAAARLAPDRLEWLPAPYEYETEHWPIDILSGGTAVRELVDAARQGSVTQEQLIAVTEAPATEWRRK